MQNPIETTALVDPPSKAPGQRTLAGMMLRYRAAAGAFGVRIAAAGLAYLLQIVLARSLGPSEYGTFNFAWSLVAAGGFLATLGFGQIGVRFLAQYHQQNATGLAQGFLRAGIGVTLAGSVAMATIGLAFFPLIEHGYGQICCDVLAIGLIALPFFALTDFMEGIARSQGWTIRALVPPYLIRQGMLILALVAAVLAGHRLNAETAMLLALAATIVAAIMQIGLLAEKAGAIFPRAKPEFAMAEWRQAAAPTLLSDLALLARQNIDLIILGLTAPAAAVGLYFAATRIASLLGLVEFAVAAAFGHRFARAASDVAGLQSVYALALRLTAMPGLLIAIMIALASPWIMALFGEGFAGALPATYLLLAGGALRLMAGPAEELLSMTGHPDLAWRANATGAVILAILCLLLAPFWQMLGAAIAAFGGMLATTVFLVVAIRRKLGFWPFLARSARGTF